MMPSGVGAHHASPAGGHAPLPEVVSYTRLAANGYRSKVSLIEDRTRVPMAIWRAFFHTLSAAVSCWHRISAGLQLDRSLVLRCVARHDLVPKAPGIVRVVP